jgi:hypothetical protein
LVAAGSWPSFIFSDRDRHIGGALPDPHRMARRGPAEACCMRLRASTASYAGGEVERISGLAIIGKPRQHGVSKLAHC